MFSPNLWSFDAPNTHITYKYNEGNQKCEKQICRRIYSHPFNKVINIILPDVKEIPENILPLLKDTDHYQVENFSLVEFTQKPFIEAFVKSGQFYGSSVDTRIDIDDCVCVTPEGILRLSVTKDVYHCLGIEGKLSAFATKHRNRYSIVIDLKNLTTTTKYYARVKKALSNELLPKFSLRFFWQPPKLGKNDDSKPICPSSIAKYFNDLGYEVNLKQTECKLNIEYSLKMPRLGDETDDPIEFDGNSNFYATPHQLIEYAGLVALSCDRNATEYLNSYSFNGHATEVGYALVIQLKGFFSCDLIRMLFKQLRDHANSNADIPWNSIYIHGDPNSPIGFSNIEHSFTHNGDNSYAIIQSSGHKYLFYEFISSNKALK